MKIAIPTLGCDGGLSGISRYAVQIIKEFAITPEIDHMQIFSISGEESIFDPSAGQSLTTTVERRHEGALSSILWHQVALPRLIPGVDLLFLPAGNRRLPFFAPCPTVGVVHDLSSLHIPAKYALSRDIYIKWVLPVLVRRLTQVITVSECSRRDIIDHCGIDPDRVTVVPHGVDAQAFGPGDSDEARRHVRTKLGVDAPYFLYVSRIEHPGKNHVRLIEAFVRAIDRTGSPHHLILAGPDRERAEVVHAAAREAGFADRIHFTGFVPDDFLPVLYRGSTALVFPSLYEGFGLPLVEAMACGVPVLCANASSLPEVAESAGLYFDPLCVESMGARLIELIQTPALRRELSNRSLERSRAFRWDHVGRQTLDVMRRAVGQTSIREKSQRTAEKTVQ